MKRTGGFGTCLQRRESLCASFRSFTHCELVAGRAAAIARRLQAHRSVVRMLGDIEQVTNRFLENRVRSTIQAL